ncbi:MAG: 50S ribosomal protein L11 methyltransferase [Cyclobacteriaceae bacterium]
MEFITIKVECSTEFSDILIAELFEIGFDSFQEFENGFEGSCDQTQFSQEALKSILKNYPKANWSIMEQEKINWNEEWEKNYDPITVDDKCLVRATFHIPEKDYEYEIVVNPKMSFGTGHHATTYQMLAFQMRLDHLNKKVLDVGSGTGILAIMAAKRGATSITASDIDDWCIENSKENFSLNQIESINLFKGQIDVINERDFDIVIANINKNVLLDQMEAYASRLKNGGTLLLSGFYADDVDDLLNKARIFGLVKEEQTTRDNWALLALTKQFI